VVETLISSEKGDVLYEWQCANAVNRMAWMQSVAQAAAAMAVDSPLGNFDRLELSGSQGRTIAQARPDRLVFVRVAHQPASA
jgi:hypothetical protein